MNIIPAVNSSSIKHALLINITINGTVYRISNAYGPITYNGNVYTQLGNFLSMTEIQGDLKITNNQLSVVLSAIPPDDGSPNYMNIALNSNLKGSNIKIYRAFFDTASGFYVTNQVYLRFNGYVSNYSLSENWDQDNKITSNNITIQCNSVHGLLEKKLSGRRTNDTDEQKFYPGDTGMSRVKALADSQFDFGKPYSAPATTTGSETTLSNDSGA